MFYQLANLIRILVGWKSHQKGSFYNERDNLQWKSKWDFYCDLYCALFLRSFKIHSRGLSDVNTYDPFHPFDIFSHLALRAWSYYYWITQWSKRFEKYLIWFSKFTFFAPLFWCVFWISVQNTFSQNSNSENFFYDF